MAEHTNMVGAHFDGQPLGPPKSSTGLFILLFRSMQEFDCTTED